MRIVILTGGTTLERNVALAGAGGVAKALRHRGHRVHVIDVATGVIPASDEKVVLDPALASSIPTNEEIAKLKQHENWFHLMKIPEFFNADVVLPVLHGNEVEGGLLQAVMELSGKQFAGSDLRGSAIAMDKEISKSLFRVAGIPTADWVRWPASRAQIEALGLPLVVKPNRSGSTVGLTLVYDLNELEAAVKTAMAVDHEVLIERFIRGREFCVGVIGGKAYTVGEIIPKHEIFDYECKYTAGMSQEVFPAELSAAQTAEIQSLALQVHQVLKLRHFSRVDFRLGEDGKFYCLEANTLPGMTATSLLPQSAAGSGMSFEALCEKICALALEG